MTQNMVLAEGTLEINATGAEQSVRNVKKELLGVRDSLTSINKESKNSLLFGSKGIKGELMHASGEIKEFMKYGLVGIASGFLSPVVGGLFSQLAEPLMDAGAQMLGLGEKADGVGESIKKNKAEQEKFNATVAEATKLYDKLMARNRLGVAFDPSANHLTAEQAKAAFGGFGSPKLPSNGVIKSLDEQDRDAKRRKLGSAYTFEEEKEYLAGVAAIEKQIAEAKKQQASAAEKTAKAESTYRKIDNNGSRSAGQAEDDAMAEYEKAALASRAASHLVNVAEKKLQDLKDRHQEEEDNRYARLNSNKQKQHLRDMATADAAASESGRAFLAGEETGPAARRRAELGEKWEREDADAGKIQTAAEARAFAQRQLDEFNRNRFERERTFGTDQKQFRIDRDDTTTGRTAFEGIEAYSRKIQERSDDAAERAEKQRKELIDQGEEIKRINRKLAIDIASKIGLQ